MYISWNKKRSIKRHVAETGSSNKSHHHLHLLKSYSACLYMKQNQFSTDTFCMDDNASYWIEIDAKLKVELTKLKLFLASKRIEKWK